MHAVASGDPVLSRSASLTPRSALFEMSGFLPRRWAVFAALACVLIVRSFTPVGSSLFMRDSLDYIAAKDSSKFLLSSVLLVITYALEAAASTLGTYLRVNMLESVAASTRKRFVKRTMAMPFDKYEKLSKGDLVSRVTSDINESSRIFTSVYFVVEVVARAIAAIGVLVYMSWSLGLLTLIVLIISTIVNARLNRPLASLGKAYQGSLGQMSAYALNAIEGQMVIKAFTAEEGMGKAFHERVRATRDKAMVIARRVGWIIVASIAGAFGTLLIAFGYGAYLAVAGRITVGAMLASFHLTDYITPLGSLGQRLTEMHTSIGAYQRVKEIMEAEEDRDVPACRKAGSEVVTSEPQPIEPDAAITVRGLSYEYVPGMKVLNDVSLQIRRGQKVAIVGRSGCGKSTLMKILAGLYRPEPNSVYVNGVDMAYRRLEKGMEQVTYVPQEPFLFAGSVSDNLSLGLNQSRGKPGSISKKAGATTEKAWAATEDSGDISAEMVRGLELGDALQFIMSSEKGLAFPVGERGSMLSGGQRQRLCLARGFLRNTPILLLDEPTSSVDREAEARILAGISSQPNLTCLLVTHRFDVAEAVDKILVMDGGQVVEAGSHYDLLSSKGLYSSMFTGEIHLSSSPSSQATASEIPSPEPGGAKS